MNKFYTQVQNDPNYAPLSPEENNALATKAKAGDEKAFDLVVEHNLRLVMKIANKFNHTPMAFDDRFQEGCQGLRYAINTYDSSYEQKFSTYAFYCIRGYVYKCLQEQGTNIVLPVNLRQRINKVKKFISQYEAEFSGEPSDAEICEALELSALQVNRVRLAMSGVIMSIHDEVTEDTERGDYLSNMNEGDISEAELLNEFTSNPILVSLKTEEGLLIKKYMGTLSEIEQKVIQLRFFDGKNLEDIAPIIDRTFQCVKQIQDRACAKIREKVTSQLASVE